jgi:hypothetical protein
MARALLRAFLWELGMRNALASCFGSKPLPVLAGSAPHKRKQIQLSRPGFMSALSNSLLRRTGFEQRAPATAHPLSCSSYFSSLYKLALINATSIRYLSGSQR